MGQTDMFRKATKKDCRSIYDLICDMENTALDYDEFSAIFNAQCEDENYYCLILEGPGDGTDDGTGNGQSDEPGDEQSDGTSSRTGDWQSDGTSDEPDDEPHVRGMLNLRFEYQLHHAVRIAEIMEFVVAPQCRNKGLGKLILNEACEIAKDHDCIQIEVACNQLRKDTHRFYEREGMKNYHYKFSRSLVGVPGEPDEGNRLGR